MIDLSTPALLVEDFEVVPDGARGVLIESLRLDPGDVVTVLGSAGAGKSLLISGFAGLVPASGRLEVAGRSLQACAPHERARRGLAWVPQGGLEVPAITVDELLDLPRRRRLRRLSDGGSGPAAGRVWRHDELDELLPGLSRCRPMQISALEATERVAVSIALALRVGPRALVLDEPTAGLNVAGLDRLRRALGAVAAAGVAVLVLTRHRPFAEALTDRPLWLNEGRSRPFGKGAGA